MTWIAASLWDLLTNPEAAAPSLPSRRRPPRREPKAPVRSTKPMQRRYDELVAEMKRAYGVRVRKWRSSMTGCAWEVHYANGGVSRLLEAPYPRGPMSCAIFLHEIGHHAIGFGTYRPRCLEEYHAWRWALDEMRERGFNVTANVEKRMTESLQYAIAKAKRRGLKRVPTALLPYVNEH